MVLHYFVFCAKNKMCANYWYFGTADHGSGVFIKMCSGDFWICSKMFDLLLCAKIEFLESWPLKESILEICSPDLLTDFANEIFRRCLRNMVASCSASGKLDVFAPISRKISLLYSFLFLLVEWDSLEWFKSLCKKERGTMRLRFVLRLKSAKSTSDSFLLFRNRAKQWMNRESGCMIVFRHG